MWKLGAFRLKISTFSRLLVVASYPRRITCRICYDLVAGMWHLKSNSISSALPAQKVSMGLVVNLKAMQQPTILFIIATSIVFIIIVINCQLAFKLDHQVLGRQSSNLSFLNFLSLALSGR